MENDIHESVRAVCLWLPEAEEFMSHGSPNFRVRGKSFASYVVNHHGDGRVALWLNAAPGAQELYVGADPKRFFVPPYLGPRGWLGVHLDKGLSWKVIAERAREAYEKVAPAALVASLGKTPSIKAPSRKLSASDIDPMQSPKGGAAPHARRLSAVARDARSNAIRLSRVAGGKEDLCLGNVGRAAPHLMLLGGCRQPRIVGGGCPLSHSSLHGT